MRRATRVVASALGAFAGFGGPEHGVFEILRSHQRPDAGDFPAGRELAAAGTDVRPADGLSSWAMSRPWGR
jgi:hypothetical protein